MLSAIKSKVTLNVKEILFINNTYQRFFRKGLQFFISSPKDNKNASLSKAFLLSFRLLTDRVGENGYVADVLVGIRKNGAAVLYDLINIYDKK